MEACSMNSKMVKIFSVVISVCKIFHVLKDSKTSHAQLLPFFSSCGNKTFEILIFEKNSLNFQLVLNQSKFHRIIGRNVIALIN